MFEEKAKLTPRQAQHIPWQRRSPPSLVIAIGFPLTEPLSFNYERLSLKRWKWWCWPGIYVVTAINKKEGISNRGPPKVVFFDHIDYQWGQIFVRGADSARVDRIALVLFTSDSRPSQLRQPTCHISMRSGQCQISCEHNDDKYTDKDMDKLSW